jgi:hypothetical protein
MEELWMYLATVPDQLLLSKVVFEERKRCPYAD